VSITWEGPDNRNDFITVVPAGAAEGESGKYTYTRDGSPLKLQVPDEAGAYELRYISAQSKTVLASLPITLTPIAANLEAPLTSPAGNTMSITWEGPNNRNDFITVVEQGAAEDQSGRYTYVREGSPLELVVPDTAGGFELRYVSGQSRRVLGRLPITLTEISATLEAAPSATAGGALSVTWTGPDNLNDFVAIVPLGAPESENGLYVALYLWPIQAYPCGATGDGELMTEGAVPSP